MNSPRLRTLSSPEKSVYLDIPCSVIMLLHELIKALGIQYGYKVAATLKSHLRNKRYIMRPINDVCELSVLKQFGDHFTKLLKSDDLEERSLHKLRSDLLVYLFRKLMDIEKLESKRYAYLKLCLELFDNGNPENLFGDDENEFRMKCLNRLKSEIEPLRELLDIQKSNCMKEKRFTVVYTEKLRNDLRRKPWHPAEGDSEKWTIEITNNPKLEIPKIVEVESTNTKIDRTDGFHNTSNEILPKDDKVETSVVKKDEVKVEENSAENPEKSIAILPYHKVIYELSKTHLVQFLQITLQQLDQLVQMDSIEICESINDDNKNAKELIQTTTTNDHQIAKSPSKLYEEEVKLEINLESNENQINLFEYLIEPPIEGGPQRVNEIEVTPLIVEKNSISQPETNTDCNTDSLETHEEKCPGAKQNKFIDIMYPISLSTDSKCDWLSVVEPSQIAMERHIDVVIEKMEYYFHALHNQQLILMSLGECGMELGHCLRIELRDYERFRLDNRTSSFRLDLLRATRRYCYKFMWLNQILSSCIYDSTNSTSSTHLLSVFEKHLGQGNITYDIILRKFMLRACKPVFRNIIKWILAGELPDKWKQFFIVRNKDVTMEEFWDGAYRFVPSELPSFLSSEIIRLLLNIGKSRVLWMQLTGKDSNDDLLRNDLQKSLEKASAQYYFHYDDVEMHLLIRHEYQKSSTNLIEVLNKKHPVMLLLGIWHRFLLLNDSDFVYELLKHMEPFLDLPIEKCDKVTLNQMLREILKLDASDFYLDFETGSGSSWSRLLLRYNLSGPWSWLLGKSMQQYESFFPSLWTLHYSLYVLKDRMWNKHQKQKLQPPEMLGVDNMIMDLHDQMMTFMIKLHHYIFDEALKEAFCVLVEHSTAQYIDEILSAHTEYLKQIGESIFQNISGAKCRHIQLFITRLILRLEAVQQKFITLSDLNDENESSKMLNTQLYYSMRRQEYQWTLQTISRDITKLKHQFHETVIDFLLALHFSCNEKFQKLARLLDCDDIKVGQDERLHVVRCFEFIRKNSPKSAGEYYESSSS